MNCARNRPRFGAVMKLRSSRTREIRCHKVLSFALIASWSSQKLPRVVDSVCALGRAETAQAGPTTSADQATHGRMVSWRFQFDFSRGSPNLALFGRPIHETSLQLDYSLTVDGLTVPQLVEAGPF